MEPPTYAEAVDALARGVGTSIANVILDSLGISVALDTLYSWGEYELLRRKMHSGFISTRLYRLLFPRRYRRLYQAYIEAQGRVQQEFLNAVISTSEPLT